MNWSYTDIFTLFDVQLTKAIMVHIFVEFPNFSYQCRIFDSGNSELNDSKVPSTSEFKTKPDGWETTSKSQDGNIWEMSQREEDILLQEFERRIAFSKFQVGKHCILSYFSPSNFNSRFQAQMLLDSS